jgi:hypothetical protein
MACQTELDPGKPFSSILFKDQEGHSTQADWFWILRPLLFSFFELPQQIFCAHYFLCCSTTRIWGFGFRFRLGTGLISDDRRASAEANGKKLAELNDG